MGDRPKPIRTLRTDLLAHPAVRAWRRLHPDHARFDWIDVLNEYWDQVWISAVYRLGRAGPDGCAIIAKRCQTAVASLERTLYAEILPRLPVPALRLHGWVEESEAYRWLFLEDAGEERYSPGSEEHRTTAARWLARLHASAARAVPAASLPDRGPGHYLGHLRSARETIRRSLANPALSAEDGEALKRITHHLDWLESCWSGVERLCEAMPRTLVHGDFAAHNLRLRQGPAGVDLLVFDWEKAGRGVPAADLAQAPRGSTGFSANPEVGAYWQAVRDEWPRLDLDAVRRMADSGTLFRGLAAMDWESTRLAYDCTVFAVSNMRLYDSRMADAVRRLGGLD